MASTPDDTTERATLQRRITTLESELADLKQMLAPVSPPVEQGACDTAGHREESAGIFSRRRVLAGGALAAGAAVAGAVAAPQAAAAADGNNMVIGSNNTSEGGNTRLNGTGAGRYNDRNVLTVSDQSASSSYESAIGAYGEGDRVFNGLYAYTGGRVGDDVTTGHAVVARNAGGRSNILLVAGGSAPLNDTVANTRGQLRYTGSDLWFCTASGTPGNWTKLASANSSGAVHAIAPARVYDSRFDDGPLGSDFNRLFSVADGIDPITGETNQPGVVPVGATAVYFNVTVAETTGNGFLLIAPGTATEVTSSSINWAGGGALLANGSLSTLDTARQLRAFVGGGGSTHFIVDITGYTL